MDPLALASSIHPFDHPASTSTGDNDDRGASDGQQSQGLVDGGALPVPPFAQRVKEMSHDSFLSCLSMSYEHLLLALHRAHKVLDLLNYLLTD